MPPNNNILLTPECFDVNYIHIQWSFVCLICNRASSWRLLATCTTFNAPTSLFDEPSRRFGPRREPEASRFRRSASASIGRRRNLTSGGSPWRRHRPMARTPKGTCGSWIRSWISPWRKRPVGSATCTEKRYRFLFLRTRFAFFGFHDADLH